MAFLGFDEGEWSLLGGHARPGCDVHENTTGTVGEASAALGRLTQYLTGAKADTWYLLVAEDFHLEASGPACKEALLSFSVLRATCGVPLSWNKTADGDTVFWV